MPRAGVEPARDCSRGILSPLRLPIPPPGLVSKDIYIYIREYHNGNVIYTEKSIRLRSESNRR